LQRVNEVSAGHASDEEIKELEKESDDAMRRALEHLEDRYGDVESYLRAAGLDEARLARLRERLVAA